MKHVVPPSTAHELTCEDRARLGFEVLVNTFGLEATKKAALAADLQMDMATLCMVARASGTNSYSLGCELLGIEPGKDAAILYGFDFVAEYSDIMSGSEYESEAAGLRSAFRKIACEL